MERKMWWFFILFFVLFSLYPTWYEITRRNDLRPNRYFELIHNFPTDYNFYLSRIRQGIEGRFTVVEKYTSEPHQGTFVHIFYLSLGWIGGWNRVPWERAGDVYHMARIALAIVLLGLTVSLAKFSLKYLPWQVLGFFLGVTASTWPKIVPEWDGWRFGGYMPWWSVMDSLQRITFLPHLLFGQALILFLLLALSNRDVIKKPLNWIFLGVLGFAMGIVFPPGILFVDTTLVIMIVIEFFFDKKELGKLKVHNVVGWTLKYVLPRFVFILLSAPSLLYLALMTSFYPWKRLAELDVIQPLPFKYDEYLLAVGPILPIGILGLIVAFFTRDRRMIVNTSWVIAWASLLIIFKSIPQQSPLRFSEMIPHVPLGMLTAYLFFILYKRVSKDKLFNTPLLSINIHTVSEFIIKFPKVLEQLIKTSKKINKQELFRISPVVIPPILLTLLFLGIMHSSWKWQRDFVDHKIRAEFPLVPVGSFVMYPLKDFIGAMKFIQDASQRSDIILSETTAGNYIPVYAGNTVYVGHDNTVNAAEKKAWVSAFFQSRLNPADAKNWISKENIRFIYYGPQEKEENNWSKELEKTYPFLKPVFQNEYVTVYEISS